MATSKRTTHDDCFDQTTAAIAGFRTVPHETRHALFRFIRARTYLYTGRGSPEQIIPEIVMDAQLKFLTRIDADLMRETVKDLVPRLLATMK